MKKRKIIFTIISSALISTFYFLAPIISKALVQSSSFNGAERQAQVVSRYVREALVFPFGKYLNVFWESILVFPYWCLILFALIYFFSKTKKIWKWVFIVLFSLYLFLFIFPDFILFFENKKPSISEGTVGRGSIENAKRIPLRGNNYTTYSFTCYLLGRTFVHDKVRDAVLDAYEICETTCPKTKFLLGETGAKHGGQFLPHKTHRNGMSIDFITPLKKGNKKVGTSYWNYHVFNLFGFGLDFDEDGKNGKKEIDFEAVALHLQALEKAAHKNGLRIKKVIFYPKLRNKLLTTSEGKKIKHLPFTTNPVLVIHDDHYHVDFALK